MAVKVLGLELEDQYADMFISAVTVNGPDGFSTALSDCSKDDINLLELIINQYYQNTGLLRESGNSNPRKESTVAFFSAATAPVLSLFIPSLVMQPLDAPKSILLAQLAYGDRNFETDVRAARGYMIERLVTQGNVWGTPVGDYLWLGERYREIGVIARELENRGSVDRGLVTELLRSTPALVNGSL